MKTERVNSSESMATRPRPTRIESDRHQHRHQARDDGAEDEEEHDERSREAEVELAVLEVALGQRVEVVRDRVIARDRDSEPGRAVALPTSGATGLIAASLADEELDQGRVPVARDGRPVAGEVAARAEDLAGVAELLDQGVETKAEELRAVDPVAVGADDDDVANRCSSSCGDGGKAFAIASSVRCDSGSPRPSRSWSARAATSPPAGATPRRPAPRRGTSAADAQRTPVQAVP